MDTPPTCDGHHEYNDDEINQYSKEVFEPSDEDGAPVVRAKRSDDDDNYTDDEDDYSDEGNHTENLRDDSSDWSFNDRGNNNRYSDEEERQTVPYSSPSEPRWRETSRRRESDRTNEIFPSSRIPREREGSGDGGPPRRPRKKGPRMSLVRMPAGKRKVPITVPDMRGWKCGDKTKLITLDPNGKMGRREYRIVAQQMEKTKKDHIQTMFKSYNIIKIEKAVNGCFWNRYRKRQAVIASEVGYVNERMYFHGSSKVKELLEFGFDERYANMNGMFGAGMYFARHSSKSNQYAFGMMGPCPTHKDINCDICERKQLLCRVAMGKTKKETTAAKRPHAPPGYHSVEGVATPGVLKYPEYIVYRGEQVYTEYVITYKTVK